MSVTLPMEEIILDLQGRCEAQDDEFGDSCRLIYVAEDPEQATELLRGLSRWSKEGGWPFRAPHHTVSEKGLTDELAKGLGGVFVLDDITSWPRKRLRRIGSSAKAKRPLPAVIAGVTFSTESPKGTLEAQPPRFRKFVADRLGDLGAELVFIDEFGVVASPSAKTAGPAAADLAVLNRHRAGLGMPPIDMAAGWTAQEIADMADNVRRHGRTHNPRLANARAMKRRLMR